MTGWVRFVWIAVFGDLTMNEVDLDCPGVRVRDEIRSSSYQEGGVTTSSWYVRDEHPSVSLLFRVREYVSSSPGFPDWETGDTVKVGLVLAQTLGIAEGERTTCIH
jgi:hypothetical protein